MAKLKGHVRPSEGIYFYEGGTWTAVTMGGFGIRYYPVGFLFDAGGQVAVGDNIISCIAYLNSSLFGLIAKLTMPTINYKCGVIKTLPNLCVKDSKIDDVAGNNIILSRFDWDSYETSWDFKQHPMLNRGNLADAYTVWKADCESRFLQLKANEEELNRIFIDIYGLQDELTPDVADKDVTVHRIFDIKDDVPESMKGSNYVRTMRDEVVSLISYAVGCMFGRYSLDVEGLAYAGGEWDSGKYQTFQPDQDNCIPITDEEYFSDDIVSRFCEWVKIVYGEKSLETNLDFIAKALGNKGNTSREVIRNYFLNDFFKDHCNTYSVTGSGRRPIYWLFDSGKQNGFKALIYMHRYDTDTVGRVRTDYLHKAQKYVETAMQSAQYTIDNATSASEKSKATKAVTKYTKQLAEMKIYDEAIAHVANQRIEIDLDDGVKVNYAKFQGVEVSQEGKKALKVDLLAKM